MALTTLRDFDASQGGPLVVRGVSKTTAALTGDLAVPQGALLIARSAGNVTVLLEDGSDLAVTGLTNGNYLVYGANPGIPVIVYAVRMSGTTLTAFDLMYF